MTSEMEAYQELFEQVRRLHNRLRWVGDLLHEGEGVTTATRSLLYSIRREGPSTVPDLARERLVSRQIIQTQINLLLEAGLVESRDNPRHARSKRIALTPKGERLVDRMMDREEQLLGSAGAPLSSEEAATACESLQTLRHHLENLDLAL